MHIISWLIETSVKIVAALGYPGVSVLMLLESCGIPFPSEVIMPFGGFLVAGGNFHFWLVVLSGTLGNVLGSCLAYAIGFYGGRPLLEKYGKYILISRHDLSRAEGWFARHGELTVLVGRLLPVIRTYISFPAGLTKMNFTKFTLYTFLGVLPWCILFTWLGVKLEGNWEYIHDKLHYLDYIVVAILLILAVFYFYKHRTKTKQNTTPETK